MNGTVKQKVSVPELSVPELSDVVNFDVDQSGFGRGVVLTVSFTNTGSMAKKVLVRCSAMRATGNVYEVWTTRVVP